MEGSFAVLEGAVVVDAAMALWKRERSSSSSGAVMAIRRGGSTRGAKMNRMGRERRRARVGMTGEEGYEKRGIMEMGFFYFFYFLWNGISEGEKEMGRFLEWWMHLMWKNKKTIFLVEERKQAFKSSWEV